MVNFFKYVFIAMLPAVTMVLGAVAVQASPAFGSASSALLVLANGTVVGFFLFLMILRSRARTGEHLPVLTAVIAISSIGAVIMARDIGPLLLLAATTPVVGWLLYDYWYSSLGRDAPSSLVVGAPLPSFVLEEEDGASVASDTFRGKPSLLLFYRGNWCPLCMAQIKEIAAQYKALSDRGVQVVLISPQSHKHTRKLAAQFDVPFRFLVDKGNRAARQLGLDVQFGIPMGMQVLGYASETVMPTALITDREGVIRFADLTDNYRVRPEPGTFLRVLDEEMAG